MLPEVKILLRDQNGDAFFGPTVFQPVRENDSYVVRFTVHPGRKVVVNEATVVYPWGANLVRFDHKVVAYPGDKVNLDLTVWSGMIPESAQEALIYEEFTNPESNMTIEEFEMKLSQVYRL